VIITVTLQVSDPDPKQAEKTVRKYVDLLKKK
jgi:hypothetical protein